MKKLFFLLLYFIITSNSYAIQLIRDTEIEDFLYDLSSCLMKSSGIRKESLKFYIVQADSINAFVAGGQNVFVNTGTIMELKEPASLLGIIAHEMGHVAAGHLFQGQEKNSSNKNIFISSTILTALALAFGNVEMAQGIMFASMQVAQQSTLKYTRDQETIADRLAVEFLEKCQYSPDALYESMNIFYMNELGVSDTLEYYTTHPLSKNRRDFIQEKTKESKFKNNDILNKKYIKEYNLIKAKIIGYTRDEESVLKTYPKSDKTLSALYARSVLYLRNGNSKASLEEAKQMIKLELNNPYFYELLGDIYYNFGNLKESVNNYQKALKILNDKPLLMLSMSNSIVKGNVKEMYGLAEDYLKRIIQIEGANLSAYKLLAELYHKSEKKGKSYVYLANYYFFMGNKRATLRNIKLAEAQELDQIDRIMIDDILKNIKDLK